MPSSANSVSDLERAEHKGFSAGVGAKRVIPYLDNGDGTYIDQPNDPTDGYKISDIDDAGYYGYLRSDGGWYIMSLISGSSRYVKGDTDYTTAWTNRATPLGYDYFNNIF
jgi:hypothetical protein